MLRYIHAQQQRHGTQLPRSKVVEFKRHKALERTYVSRLSNATTINVLEHSLPDAALFGSKRIKEIIFAGRCVVIVTEAGICRAYAMVSAALAADLNPSSPWKKVTTAVYNKENDYLTVVYEPNPGCLQCAVFVASDFEHGMLRSPAIACDFEAVSLCHPAFFEFDEANNLVLVAQQGDVQSFQFWSHSTFKLLFSIHGEEFEEVRISYGLVAMFKAVEAHLFCATVFDIENGKRLAEVPIPIDQYRRVEFLELLVSQLLFKQERASLRVINLLDNGTSVKVAQTRDTFAPLGFVFFEAPDRVLGKKYFDRRARRFFTISPDTVQFWMIQHEGLEMLHTIRVQGLREAGMCQQGVEVNLLAVYHCYNETRKAQLDTHVANNQSQPSRKNGFNSLHSLCEGAEGAEFVSALQMQRQQAKGNAKMQQQLETDHPCGPTGPTKRGLTQSCVTQKSAVHFYSMEDGQLVGRIPTGTCGANVEVLQISIEYMAVGVGDHLGRVRLFHAPQGCASGGAQPPSSSPAAGLPNGGVPALSNDFMQPPWFQHGEQLQRSDAWQEKLLPEFDGLGLNSRRSSQTTASPTTVQRRHKRLLHDEHERPRAKKRPPSQPSASSARYD